VHGHTRLELIWTVIPVLILCAIGTVVFFQLPKIDSAPASTNPLQITLEAHQFYWQFDYPDKTRSINTLYVPVGRVVDLKVIATDVIHSWWIPALGGKIQAIPGRINHTWFMAEKPGTYEGQCAELCGVYHASMVARVVAGRPPSSVDLNKTLGQQEWQGVCATCHGNLGQGGYGPNVANNSILTQVAALRRTLRFGVTGPTGAMPPVGDTWNSAQIQALVDYVKKHIYKAAPIGG
jgi:cytochrome c oxidase subunit 2